MSSTVEETQDFIPRFDEHGLIGCITVCADTNEVLMFAYMNAESLDQSLKTGEAYYWSRSRKCLWHKGETSGATQKIVSIYIDCDQDCLLMRVKVSENKNDTCHTGRNTCFYREIDSKTKTLKFRVRTH